MGNKKSSNNLTVIARITKLINDSKKENSPIALLIVGVAILVLSKEVVDRV